MRAEPESVAALAMETIEAAKKTNKVDLNIISGTVIRKYRLV